MSIKLEDHLDTRVRKIGFMVNRDTLEYKKAKKNILLINCINRNIFIDPNNGNIYGTFQFKNARFVSALYNIINLNIWTIDNGCIRELNDYIDLQGDIDKFVGSQKGKEEKWISNHERRVINNEKNKERMRSVRKNGAGSKTKKYLQSVIEEKI
jgi:hypothetical protein